MVIFHRKSLVCFFNLGLLLSLTLLGCTPDSSQSPSSPPTSETSTAVSGETRIIEHAMGRTEIQGTPQRVVVLTNEGTDIALALGITPVGAVKSWQGNVFYDYVAHRLEGVPVVGDEFKPNFETILNLKPDLILGSKVRQKRAYKKLSAIAPTVFSETLGKTWKDNVKLYSQALNRESQAQQLLTDWERRIAEFREKLGDTPPTVSLVRFLPGVVRIYYQESFPGQIVAEAGLSRPQGQQKDKFADAISLEKIEILEADYLFYFTYNQEKQKGEDIKNQWLKHSLWQTLEVVQKEQAYEVSDAEWTSSSGVLAANQVLDDLSQAILKLDSTDPAQ
ncbi:MAG: iron-siderophore ABC transporter substrate-binding protein [Symploca sp. SIO2G7]|nr:iron-siderophore ABC transporter substrate-binding protein [Symploca sp. SIO2G7]